MQELYDQLRGLRGSAIYADDLRPILDAIVSRKIIHPDIINLAMEVATKSIPVDVPRLLPGGDSCESFGRNFDEIIMSDFLHYVWGLVEYNHSYAEGLDQLYHTIVCFGSQGDDVTCEEAYRVALTLLIRHDHFGFWPIDDGELNTMAFGVYSGSVSTLGRRYPSLQNLLKYLELRAGGQILAENDFEFQKARQKYLDSLKIEIDDEAIKAHYSF